MVGEVGDIKLEEGTGPTMEEEGAADSDQDAEGNSKEESNEERFEQEDPDSRLRRLRRLEQRSGRNYSDEDFGNSNDSDSDFFLASALSKGSEEGFCMKGIASKISTGPGESTSGT